MKPCGEGTDNPCDDALNLLYEYLDGELTDEKRATIGKHLDDCGYCLGAFDFETELRHAVAKRCQDRVPDALRSRIAEAIGIDTNP